MRIAPTSRSSATSSVTSSPTDTVPDFSGRLRASGRVAILVSRYNELITTKLLDGALACCREAGMGRDQIDVVWVPGAFELPVAAATAARTGSYAWWHSERSSGATRPTSITSRGELPEVSLRWR